MNGHEILLLCLAVCGCLQSSHAATSIVIGNPTVTLPAPGQAVLTGLTIRYNEPDFLGITENVDAYLGVPYAHPPLGNLRFADPKPYVIQGSYNATENRDECMQSNFLGNIPNPGPPFPPDMGRDISEDCLFLTIYTPSPKPTSPKAVFAWIHGGGYSWGSGSQNLYDPIPLVASTDIIYVGINYRLGVFGFMTTGDDVATGNYGMMDQILAMQWIQDNIAAFGGDPERVTIAGESAGGTGVGLHMLSPLSHGLFHRTIQESGNAMCGWAAVTMESAAEGHRSIAENLDCPTADSQAMLDCMREADALELHRTQFLAVNGAVSSPVIDGHFLPAHHQELIKRGQFVSPVPSIIGSNQDEAALNFLGNGIYEPPHFTFDEVRARIRLMSYNGHRITPEEALAVEQEYIDWSVADNETADQFYGYMQISTDQTYACPSVNLARTMAARGDVVYHYEMTHDPNWSAWGGIPQWTGATHFEEIPFIFAWGLSTSLGNIADHTDAERFMSIEFMRYWSNFVISGDPNEPVGSTEYPEWPRFTMLEQWYKDLSLNMTNRVGLRAADCGLWRNLMPRLDAQTANMEDVYEDWQYEYDMWRNVDIPNWSAEFETYKEENTCSVP